MVPIAKIQTERPAVESTGVVKCLPNASAPLTPHRRPHSPGNSTQPQHDRNLQPALPHDVREQRVIHIRTFELGRLFTEPVFEGVKVAHFAEEGAFAGGNANGVSVSAEWRERRVDG